MNRSNIIISIIVVLCIATGVTAYGLSHENNIFSGLSTFTPTGNEHTDNGLGNNTTIQQNDTANTSSANTQNKESQVSQNQELKSNNGNIVTNKTVNQNTKKSSTQTKTNKTKTNDGWINESTAIAIAGGYENLVSIKRSGDMYIITYKMYVEKAGQFPKPGWYNVSIGVSKSGKNLGLV